MKKQIALLVLFFFVVLGCKKDDVEPDYSDKFAGVWKGVRITQNGQTVNIKGVQNASLTLTFTRVETNKVKMSMIVFNNGTTNNVSPEDVFQVKNLDINNYELVFPPTSGGSGYITLNVNSGELKFGGFSGGTAFEYVFTK